MLEVPDDRSRRATEDIASSTSRRGLSFMNIAFAALTTNLEYQRAVHSLQLDESLLGCLAELTGDEAFRAWRPPGYALVVQDQS